MDWTYFRVLKVQGERFNWGDESLMSEPFLNELDEFLAAENLEPIITEGTGGKHLANSEHPRGYAVDIMFLNKGLEDLPDIFLNAWRYKFTGIGIYSQWKLNKLEKNRGGLHLQMVPEQLNDRKRMWLNGGGEYEAVKMSRLVELFK